MEASPVARASVGIQVVDLKTGNALYSRNAERLYLPASNMKLFTAALALERLGPEYRLTTRLVRAPSGDLILVGGGDPSMSGRTYPYQKSAQTANPLQAIEELADQAVAAGSFASKAISWATISCILGRLTRPVGPWTT